MEKIYPELYNAVCFTEITPINHRVAVQRTLTNLGVQFFKVERTQFCMIGRDLGGNGAAAAELHYPIRKTLKKSAVALSERQNDG